MAKKQTVELDFIGDTSQLEKAAKRVKAVISDLPKNAPISDVGRSTAGYLEKPSGKLKPTLKTTTSEQNGVTTTVSKDQLGNISYKQHMSGSSVLRSRLAQAAQAYDNSLAQMVDPFKRGQHILKKASALEDVVRKHGAEGSSANARAEGHIRSLRRAASKEISSGVSNQLQGILSTLKNENLKTKDSNLHEANYLKAATSLNKLKKAAGISSKDVAAIEKAHKALDATLPRMGEHQFRAKVSTTAESFDAKLSKVIDPLKRGALLNKKAEALQGLRDSYSGEEGATTRKVAKDIRAAKQAAAKAISDGVTSQVSDIKTRLDIANRQAPDADTKLTNYANALSELNKAKNALGASSKDKAAIDKARKQLQADLPKTWTNQFNENLASVEASYAKKIAKITDPMKRAKLLDKQAAELQNIIDTQGKEDSAATRKAAASVQRLSKASAKAMSQGVSERLKGITNTLENDNRKETDKGRVTDNYIRASDAINKLKKTAGISQKDVDALTRAQRKLESYLPKTNVAASQERLADKLGAISHIMKSAFAKNASSPLLSKSDQIQQDLVHANEALSRINQLENQANSARAQKQISKARLGVQTKIGALTASQASLDHQEVRREAAQRANANMEIGWGAQFVAFGLFQSALDVVTRAFYSLVSVVQQVAMGLKDMFLSFLRVNEKFAGMETTVASALGDPKHAKNIVDEIATIAGKSFLPTDDLLNMYRSASVLPQFRSKFIEESSAGALGEKDSSFQQFRQLIEQMVTFRPDKTATDAIFSLREALGGNFVSLGKRFDVSVNTIANVTGTSRAAMKASPEKTLETLQKFFGAIISPEAVAKMTNQPTRLFENIMEQFTVLMPRILGNTFFAEVGQSLYEYALNPFVQLLEDVLSPFFEEDGTFEQTYAEDLAKAVKNLFDTLVAAVRVLAQNILPHIEKAFGINSTDADSSAKGLLGRAIAAFTASLNWLSDKLPTVVSEVVKVLPALVNMFKTLLSVLEGVLGVFKILFAISPKLAAAGMIAAPSLPILLASMVGAGLRTGIRGSASLAGDAAIAASGSDGDNKRGSWYSWSRAVARPFEVGKATTAGILGKAPADMPGNYVARLGALGTDMKGWFNNKFVPGWQNVMRAWQVPDGFMERLRNFKQTSGNIVSFKDSGLSPTLGERVKSASTAAGLPSGGSVASAVGGFVGGGLARLGGLAAGVAVGFGELALAIAAVMGVMWLLEKAIKKIAGWVQGKEDIKNLGSKTANPVSLKAVSPNEAVKKYMDARANGEIPYNPEEEDFETQKFFEKNQFYKNFADLAEANKVLNAVSSKTDKDKAEESLKKATKNIELTFAEYESLSMSNKAIVTNHIQKIAAQLHGAEFDQPVEIDGEQLGKSALKALTETYQRFGTSFEKQFAEQYSKRKPVLFDPFRKPSRLDANILPSDSEGSTPSGRKLPTVKYQETVESLTAASEYFKGIDSAMVDLYSRIDIITEAASKADHTNINDLVAHNIKVLDQTEEIVETFKTKLANTLTNIATEISKGNNDLVNLGVNSLDLKNPEEFLSKMKAAVKLKQAGHDDAIGQFEEIWESVLTELLDKNLSALITPLKTMTATVKGKQSEIEGLGLSEKIALWVKTVSNDIRGVTLSLNNLGVTVPTGLETQLVIPPLLPPKDKGTGAVIAEGVKTRLGRTGGAGGTHKEFDPWASILSVTSSEHRQTALAGMLKRQAMGAIKQIGDEGDLGNKFMTAFFSTNDSSMISQQITVLEQLRDKAIEAGRGLDVTSEGFTKAAHNAAAFQDKISQLKEIRIQNDPMMQSLKEISEAFKNSLGSAISDFIMGTKSAGEAMRAFASEFISAAVRILVNKAVESIFGSMFGGAGGGKGGAGGAGGGGGGGSIFDGIFKFFGSLFGGATGGKVSAFGIGSNQPLHFATGGGVYGGSGKEDDIPAMLMGGEFVVRKSAVDKYGIDMLERLNSGRLHQMALGGKADYLPKYAMGGRVGYMPQYANGGAVEMPHYAEGGNVMPLIPAPAAAGSASSQQNNNISITINKDGTSSEKKSGDNNDNSSEMARQIKHSVLEILQNEQRLGGMFRKGAMGTAVSGR